MNHPRRAGDAQGLAQERGLLGIALHQMDDRAWRFRQGASQHHAGKTTAAAEIDPDLGRGSEGQKLQRIRDVPGPQIWQRRGRHKIGFRLPFQQQVDIPVQPRLRFT